MKRRAGLESSPTPSLRSISAFVGLMIPSTLIVPILLISLSVSESCFRGCRVEVITKSLRTLTRVTYVQGEWLGYLYKRCDRMTCHYWHATTFNDTFCPRNRLFAERIVNPSPGPSSTVELATTASLSFSVLFLSWKTEHIHASYNTITNTWTNIEMFAIIHEAHSCVLTLGLRPGLPLPFLVVGFLMLLTRSALFSGTVTWVSTFTRLPLFLDNSSGWIRGRTPPFDMVTPRRS